MNELDTITATKINTMHEGIITRLTECIDKAIEIGELLSAKKEELKHGEFCLWIKDNLIFTDRTARNYMRLFENKDKILQAGNISEAYKMLEAPKTETVSDLIESKIKRIRIDEIMNKRQSIKKTSDAKIEYIKNHPDSISTGKMKFYNIAGYKCKTEIVGQLQCLPGPLLPIISHEIVDERFLTADEIQQKNIIKQVNEFDFHHGWDKWGLEIEL